MAESLIAISQGWHGDPPSRAPMVVTQSKAVEDAMGWCSPHHPEDALPDFWITSPDDSTSRLEGLVSRYRGHRGAARGETLKIGACRMHGFWGPSLRSQCDSHHSPQSSPWRYLYRRRRRYDGGESIHRRLNHVVLRAGDAGRLLPVPMQLGSPPWDPDGRVWE
jgi:hypothetical protein